MEPIRVLFVCGRNRRRSPTAEMLYRADPRFSVRSGGTSESSKRRVQHSDLQWADLIIVMERKYEARLRARFPEVESFPPTCSLDIPDDFEFGDEELIDLLQPAVAQAYEDYVRQKTHAQP